MTEKSEKPAPGERRGKAGKVSAAIRAAARAPSRAGDQVLFWGVRTLIEATKTLGFPVVLVFVLIYGAYLGVTALIAALNTMPQQFAASIATEATERRAQHEESRKDSHEIRAAVDANRIAVDAKAKGEDDYRATVLGIVQGRWRCPAPRPCPSCPSCAPQVTVIAQPAQPAPAIPSGEGAKGEQRGMPTRPRVP